MVAGEEEKDRRIAELERQLAERERQIEKLERKVEQLERINEDLRRAGKRQATPFSRGEPKAKPKRRGRKKGKRYGARASRPVPKQIDRVVHVAAPMYCPQCQKPTKLIGQEKQWQTDIPPVQATTTEFQIDIARCTKCGRALRARHADQTSDAVGAAGVQIGPRAIAFAAKFNKECGVSYGRIADIFDKGFGLVVSRSTLTRAVERLADTLEPAYRQIGQTVQSRPMLSPDETGWKIGGHKAWLHVAATREESYFKIAPGRGRAEAEELIGKDYCGTIVRDGWVAYRGENAFSKASSQTCLAHILRRIKGLIEIGPEEPALCWLAALKKLLKRAIRIRDRRDDARPSIGYMPPARSLPPSGGSREPRARSHVHLPVPGCRPCHQLSRRTGHPSGRRQSQNEWRKQHSPRGTNTRDSDERASHRPKAGRRCCRHCRPGPS